MSSLFIPLILVCLVLALNTVRGRAKRIASTESWADDGLDMAIGSAEASPPAAAIWAASAEPLPDRVAPPPDAAAVPPSRPPRYLLDGDDPAPRAVDRVARMRRTISGAGLCSPRRPL